MKQLDLLALYDALDAKRLAWGMTWQIVCRSADVSQSTVTRISQGRNVMVTTLAPLMHWFGETDLAPYLVDAPGAVRPATRTGTEVTP